MTANKESIAIYHIIKISNTQLKKRVQGEARIANKFIEDIETKFEFALFNAPKEVSYMELYIYFLGEWERIVRSLQRRKFTYIRINSNHFDNLYLPKTI